MNLGDLVRALHTFQNPHLHLKIGLVVSGTAGYWHVMFGDEFIWFNEKDLEIICKSSLK